MILRRIFNNIVIASMAFGLTSFSFAQDSATFDAKQGTWRLYYQDPETEQWITKHYVARTAIEPRIKTHISWAGKEFAYRYKVSNGKKAKQTISIIRIWGIPQVYQVPNLPPLTTDMLTNQKAWWEQTYAQGQVKRDFEKTVVKTPVGWSGGIRVDDKVNQTSFVWSPGLKDTDSDGIEPGRSQSGFAVFRPELPGVARTYMQGRIAEPWGLDNVPDTPFWSQKVDEIQDQDYLLVPVLAPVISIPEPYNGAELARRLRSHAQTWVKYGHATPDALARLNRQFDVLIPALETGNKSSARTAVVSMLTEAFTHHHGMTHDKADEDDDEHDGQPLAREHQANPSANAKPIDRIAARALTFNLRYVLHRMH